jgi:hypothetical protein
VSRALGVLILLVLLAVGGAYALSPLYAYHQLRQAAEAGDRDRLDALVDFPAVRENLKAQVDSKAVKLARSASGIGHPIAMLLGKLGAAVGDKAVDRIVTPEGISQIITVGRAARGKHRDEDDDGDQDDSKGQGEAKAKDKPKTVIHYGYLTPDRFRIRVAPASAPDAEIGLIMDRRGLFAWRVEEIELPK